MEAPKKVRSPNFTTQECMLLAHIMGDEYEDFGLSRHKVDKHKFNSKITSTTKKRLWIDVEKNFNANSPSCVRTALELQKKWENLVTKERAIYADHQRILSLTGSGPVDTKFSLLTEAVMSVVGKETVSVAGVASFEMDTTLSQMQQSSSLKNESESSERGSWHVNRKSSADESDSCTCTRRQDSSFDDLKALRKRKLELQIQFYEMQIKKLKEE